MALDGHQATRYSAYKAVQAFSLRGRNSKWSVTARSMHVTPHPAWLNFRGVGAPALALLRVVQLECIAYHPALP